MRLLLIRHGESEGNTEMRLQGRGDYPLTERGLAQALRLAERLRGLSLAALYSSPIRRAWLTADVIGEATGLDATELPGVQEYDFGEVSGITFRELLEKHPEIIEQYRRGPDYPSFPGGESREDFRRRVCETLWGLAARHPGASVAVVTHAGPIVVFCLEVLGLPYQRPVPLRVHNGSVTVVHIRDGPWDAQSPFPRATLSAYNDTCHLWGTE
jgi:probable phosphoglycerate mutase